MSYEEAFGYAVKIQNIIESFQVRCQTPDGLGISASEEITADELSRIHSYALKIKACLSSPKATEETT